MKKLGQFVDIYEAGRGRPRKNKDAEDIKVSKVKVPGIGEIDVIDDDDELSPEAKKILAQKAKKAERKVGKDESKNGTKNRFAIKPKYTEDDAVTPLSEEDMNENLENLMMKFDGDEPFFIQGEAGWGKTSVITDMARRYGRSVITVYLDKAVATDLGGIPVPIEGKDGTAKLVNAMPEWAAYMLEHEDEDFLLFFDEMNQAAPDVMNALMPIVLENVICNIQFKNFMVGAAGNFEHENKQGISELSGPLKSRFKPIIKWVSGTEESWKGAFKFLYKEWGDKMPKKLMDVYADAAMAFENPREVEHKVIKWAYTVNSKIKSGKANPKLYKVEMLKKRFDGLIKENIENRELRKKVAVVVEETFKWMINSDEYDKESKSGRTRSKNADMIPNEMKDQITAAIKRGYMMSPQVDADGKPLKNPDKRKYGVSRENIYDIFCTDEYHGKENNPDVINREMLDRLINKLEADGVTFKYEKNSDWQKAGMVDPLED